MQEVITATGRARVSIPEVWRSVCASWLVSALKSYSSTYSHLERSYPFDFLSTEMRDKLEHSVVWGVAHGILSVAHSTFNSIPKYPCTFTRLFYPAPLCTIIGMEKDDVAGALREPQGLVFSDIEYEWSDVTVSRPHGLQLPHPQPIYIACSLSTRNYLFLWRSAVDYCSSQSI